MKKAIIITCIILIVFWVLTVGSWLMFGPIFPLVQISGGSMEPTYHDGQLVLVYDLTRHTPSIGDVIVYRMPGNYSYYLIAHRVVEILPAGYITQGDANDRPDQEFPGIMYNEPVRTEQIYGVVY